MDKASSPARGISFFFVAVVTVLLVLSFISLYQAAVTYRKTGSADYMTIILCVSAIALSSYMVLQMRRKPLKLGFEMPRVFTTVQCSRCDFKNVREFQKGDYVLRAAEPCPKCNVATFISSIFREAEEKEE